MAERITIAQLGENFRGAIFHFDDDSYESQYRWIAKVILACQNLKTNAICKIYLSENRKYIISSEHLDYL